MITSLEPVITSQLLRISKTIAEGEDWKVALTEITQVTRTILIFDNLVIYLMTPDGNLDVLCAKAVGRGKQAQADIAWGELIANRVAETHQPILEVPDPAITERLEKAHLLGLPLLMRGEYLGSMVLIRFGGPPFPPDEIRVAEIIAQLIALLADDQKMQGKHAIIEEQVQQLHLKEDFVSTISHELRNPLGVIKGYTTTLLRADTSWELNIQQDFLNIIDRETDHLQELIENLLDSSRLQSGKMPIQLQMIRLDTVIKDVAGRILSQHPTMKLKMVIDPECKPVRGDSQRLAQVFDNLLSNAIKYAPDSEVSITINQDEQCTLITVEDHGPGIPRQYLPFVFTRFFRNPDQPPGIHGTGLGLFISKMIIEAHHGKISVLSQVGQGTTFMISLPRHETRSEGKLILAG